MSQAINLDKLPRTIELERDSSGPRVCYVDQRALPSALVIETTRDWRCVVDAVKTLAVRGAPAIGIAGAAALALWATYEGSQERLAKVANEIGSARPTAVNLRWAVDRACDVASRTSWADVPEALQDFVEELEREDEAANRAIGENGSALVSEGARILTHCNAGSLAASFYGTALGVVYSAAMQGKVCRVYADETRPVLQGARLTVWELARVGIPVTLICDNMAASLMAKGEVDAVLVGADRIAANGDTANKIGTYGLSVLAKEHGVPFYVAAPFSTVDPTIPNGACIEIEERDPSEVLADPMPGVDVWNPAFDVTPARLITKIITEKGVFDPDALPL